VDSVRTTNLGYPRIGRQRELKKATEAYWKGTLSEDDLRAAARRIEEESWRIQGAKGIDLVPVNDMSLYDHVLDTACLFLAIPPRYGHRGDTVDLATYFAMARGRADAPAMEMTKWFDTNYHYIVPELDGGFRLNPEKPVAALRRAREREVAAPKVVIVGPYTFVALAKSPGGKRRAELLAELAPLYGRLVALLSHEGAAAVQLDEPALVLDTTDQDLALLEETYRTIAREAAGAGSGSAAGRAAAPIHLATYFGSLGDAYSRVVSLPIAAVQIDFVRDPRSIEDLRRHGFPEDKSLVAGIVNGRNVWKTDLAAALKTLEEVGKRVPSDRLWLSPSASLLHLPHSVALEKRLDPAIRLWLAYADERLDEVAVLARALREGPAAARAALEESARVVADRGSHPLAVNPEVRSRTGALGDADFRRAPYAERDRAQRARLSLPALPTTTIGSFPQTNELRRMRERFRKGEITRDAYDGYVRSEIANVIRLQEEIGLDLLVHGEFERSDMVDYFAERLRGMAFIEGWVQSYGTRYVRPPLIYGDVSRPKPMTVEESRYAQSLTKKPMKGMLTGPVTILQWSFPREDLSREAIAYQLALAIRDETVDLEGAGIPVIQIDEPAFREGLPLRRADRPAYLAWAVRAFRLASSGVAPQTMIHSHMCYSEFNEIIGAIEDLDADVVSIESSRSGSELLGVFRDHKYGRGIGPGVYDVHSERVPPADEMAGMLRRALETIPSDRLWVNPDCGLKTRAYPETVASLKNLVAAAKAARGAGIRVSG
jgi:5-methyltetrahydropteroyltriglutamate--homocysteine methyltransferase